MLRVMLTKDTSSVSLKGAASSGYICRVTNAKSAPKPMLSSTPRCGITVNL